MELRSSVSALIVIACLAALGAFFPAPVLAQVDTGNISGAVTDETGAMLPGVTITATNLSTGTTRTTVTSGVGRYQITGLQPAGYSVKAELQGFNTVLRPQVTVNVGTTIDINISLRLASMAETVNVTSDAPLVESGKSELSNVINQQVLEAVPSLNRQYLDFALLLPATVDSVSINQQGAGFSLGGARSSEAALLVDGFYNMDEGFALPKQRYSQDAVQEFQVISFGGQAEYGRAIGGILNGVTKSGANLVHGTAYGFLQNQNLNNEDPASVLRGIDKPDYSRQQWGGTLGGPIKHDKTFFFGAYERVKQEYTYDNAITAANGAAIGLPAADVGNVPREYLLNFVMGKVDHNISENSRIQASVAMSRWTEDNVSSPQAFSTRSRQFNLQATDLSYLFKFTKVAGSGHAVHEMKISFFPRYYGVNGVNAGGPPLAADGQINPPGENQSNSTLPAVNISSIANFGSISLNNTINTFPVEAIYNSSVFLGKHSVKFGADYMNAEYDYTLYSSLRATYTFSSVANYLKGAYSQFTQGFGDPANFRRHQYIAGFAQDSWRAGDRLTLNYGVRYDLEVHPKAPTGERFGWDRNNVGPRFGGSYDLTGKNKTFLKFSSGVYYDRIFQNITTFYTNIVGYQTLVSGTWTPTTPGAPVYPNVLTSKPATMPAGVVNSNIMPSDFRTPASTQTLATIEHSLTPSIVVSASAIYTHLWDVDYTLDMNLTWNGTAWVRPNPAYRVITQYQFDGAGNYAGGIFEVKRRGTRVGFNGSVTVQRARDMGNNYNSAPNDQRTGIAGEYGPNADTPTVRGVLSGWYNITPTIQVSGKVQSRSGMWVNPIASGIDLVGAGTLGSRTPGFGRNEIVGPGYSQTDMRFTWALPVPNQKISFYVEAFNAFNQVNAQGVNNNYGAVNGSPLSVFMTPTVYYAPRQVQLGIHWSF
jgi:hypothetical protein